MAPQGRELSVPGIARIFRDKSAAILNFSKFLKQSVHYLCGKFRDHLITIRDVIDARRYGLSEHRSRLAGGFSDLEIFLTGKFFFLENANWASGFSKGQKKTARAAILVTARTPRGAKIPLRGGTDSDKKKPVRTDKNITHIF